jgi:Uma2 family endonuclease
VLSPSTRGRDLGVKARRYAELGIPHYWLVDPAARRIECLALEAGVYRPVLAAEGDDRLSHPEWPELTVDLATLWR